MRGLTEGLEIEFAKYGIKVRSLMPGFIDTPLLDQVSADSNEPAYKFRYLRELPLNILAFCTPDRPL